MLLVFGFKRLKSLIHKLPFDILIVMSKLARILITFSKLVLVTFR